MNSEGSVQSFNGRCPHCHTMFHFELAQLGQSGPCLKCEISIEYVPYVKHEALPIRQNETSTLQTLIYGVAAFALGLLICFGTLYLKNSLILEALERGEKSVSIPSRLYLGSLISIVVCLFGLAKIGRALIEFQIPPAVTAAIVGLLGLGGFIGLAVGWERSDPLTRGKRKSVKSRSSKSVARVSPPETALNMDKTVAEDLCREAVEGPERSDEVWKSLVGAGERTRLDFVMRLTDLLCEPRHHKAHDRVIQLIFEFNALAVEETRVRLNVLTEFLKCLRAKLSSKRISWKGFRSFGKAEYESYVQVHEQLFDLALTETLIYHREDAEEFIVVDSPVRAEDKLKRLAIKKVTGIPQDEVQNTLERLAVAIKKRQKLK